MQISGAQLIIKCLEEQGVNTVFGYPGGAILPFYDALRESTGVRHILTAHEQGAAHAADGYARASGGVGVCVATSGPGATNLVTGLATAFMDSIPVVAITGQVAMSMIGRDAFQEVDITGITPTFTRAMPKNLLEISQIVSNLWGKVSRKTLLSQVPFVDDVDEELKAVEKEEQENLEKQQAMFGLGSNTPPGTPPKDDVDE